MSNQYLHKRVAKIKNESLRNRVRHWLVTHSDLPFDVKEDMVNFLETKGDSEK